MSGDRGQTPPRVLVLHDVGSALALELAEAARNICEIIWLTGWPGSVGPPPRLLRRLGRCIDLSALDATEGIAVLRAQSPAGIAVFSDSAIEPAAAIADALGLPFHDPETARRLRDKWVQRTVLAAAGLDAPASRAFTVGAIRTPQDARALGVSWPAVLKPRRGTASIDTFLVEDDTQLVELLADLAPDGEFVLEDYLPDRCGAGRGAGSEMFSVELLVDGARAEPIALTGRLRLAPPLRETGAFIPGDVGERDAAEAIEAARTAAAALGVERGILHIEFKLTPHGPRIIEVNGRPAGALPRLLTRVGGPSMLALAFELALGRPVAAVAPPAPGGPVAFFRVWLPPVGRHRLESVDGLAALLARPEIEHAWLNVSPGETVDSREGGGVTGYIAFAWGVADGPEALRRLDVELDDVLSAVLTPLGPAG